MIARRKLRRRDGVAVVETALVVGVFGLLFFGIFEYCRFLMVLHITNNAARDGARYAAVNVGKPNNFDTVDYTDGLGVVHPSIQKYTLQRMGSMQKQVTGFQIAVFAVDPTGLTLDPPVIRPKTTSTASPAAYPDPFNASDPNKVPWNDAVFTERVGVSIKGTYTPVLPGFLFMPSSIPIYVTAMACSEG